MKIKKQKRFTLIELIIVIVTIGILAGMALPKFIDVKRQAEHAKLLNNIDAVQEAIQICYLDNDQYPVYLHKVDFYSLNDTVASQILSNGETGEQIYKVKVDDSSVATLSSLLSSVFAADSDDPGLETDTFHTKLKYGLGKYGVNDYYLYSEETGKVYYANGDLLDDSDSAITPLTKDGTYYMTVNAGDVATWIDHYSEDYIPDGGSITYEWATTNNRVDTRDNSKLTWTSDFTSLPKTQYLKTRITIKSPEGGDQTKLYKYRVQYLADDYDEIPITPDMIKTKDVIKDPHGRFIPSGINPGTIEITLTNTSGINSILPNIPGVNYDDITISGSGGSSSDPYGPGGKHPLSDIDRFGGGPVTITMPVYPVRPITIPTYLIAIKDELDWQTIDTLTFECDAMQTTKWLDFDYIGFVPENTRIRVFFSTSDDDKTWSSETTSIGNTKNSEYIRARIELQKNQYAKQDPSISEVFFDNASGSRYRAKKCMSSTEDNLVASITINPNTNLYPDTNINFDYSNSTDSNNISITNAEWKIDDIGVSNPNGTFAEGTHTVSLRVQNENGLWSDWTTQSFDVQPSRIPIATITINPTSQLYSDTNITFDYSNSIDPYNKAIINAEWKIDDVDVSNPNGIYSIGTHTVSLRVENSDGFWSDWVTKSFTTIENSNKSGNLSLQDFNFTIYDSIVYVDCNTTVSKSIQNGSKDKPFSDINNVLSANQSASKLLIVLGEGTYDITVSKINTTKVDIVGQNEKTNLVFNPRIIYFVNSACYYGFPKDMNFYNMKISTIGSNPGSNYFENAQSNISFNNVVFSDLYTDGYSVFLTENTAKTTFNNCTFAKSFSKLIRTTTTGTTFNNSYAVVTYGSSTKAILNNTPTITSINLDNNYNITDPTINNSSVGVYSGTYAWK